MNRKECLKKLVEDIHSVVIATIDQDGRPTTRVIDIMLYDAETIYFLTAKGKQFYAQLMEQNYISLSGTKNKISINIKGNTRNIGNQKLDEIFLKNPYMQQIYPADTRKALEVFCIDTGQGEYFDISNPSNIQRSHFTIGDTEVEEGGYFVNTNCILCGTCFAVCPQQCIDTAKNPVVIEQSKCLHCGNCYSVCPVHAIERK